MAAGSIRHLGSVCGDVARAGGRCEPTSKALFPRVISRMDVCVRKAEGGFLRGCEPRFDHRRNHIPGHAGAVQAFWGALYPSKSGLMNKHILRPVPV